MFGVESGSVWSARITWAVFTTVFAVFIVALTCRIALVCVASGEPGKDDVLFAGRLLRHLGAQAKLFTTLGRDFKDDYQRQRVERFVGGGVSHQSGASLRTPMASIGVRGGSVLISIGGDCGTLVVHQVGTVTCAKRRSRTWLSASRLRFPDPCRAG